MLRTITIILLLSIGVSLNAQNITAAETVKNYSTAEKRLLVISMAQFINILTQNNLDQDSVMSMACRITAMPFLLPYNEGFVNKVSGGEDLINAGKIAEAKLLLESVGGEKQIQLLIELAIWYLHQPSAHKTDLNNSSFYIETASKLSTTRKYKNWQTECALLIGELNYQKGNLEDGKNAFAQIISSSQSEENLETMARAYQHASAFLPNNDSLKLSYYQKAFDLYQKLNLKEKGIELLENISSLHHNSSLIMMEQDLRLILSLMQSIGFKHVLFTQNILAYALYGQGKLIEGLQYAKAALENMKWSGINAAQGTFYCRIGAVYESFEKNQEALTWFIKALDSGTNQTHLFWYKSLFFVHSLLILENKPSESLTLIYKITSKSPPLTLWEKIQVLACKGECYEHLNIPKLADENYMSLLKMANDNPLSDPFGELSETYYQISKFYISQKDLKKARLFQSQGLLSLSSRNNEAGAKEIKYSLLYEIDSLEGNYKSALQNHINYKLYYDSFTNVDQRKKMDELTVKYAAEKKDQDIRLLKQQGIAQQAELKQNKLTRNIMIAGATLLLIIVGLLFSQYKLKQRTNVAMNKKNLALQHLVEEKEWLLKEVHHRVKNNLHTVICLLESQAAYLQDDALKAIENSQHRIYAMSLIHQKLYQSEDVKTIDMSVYLPEFIRYLDDSFGTHYHVNFQLDIEQLMLGVSQAIPIALII
ncbi:MAG TPA: sensor histidine kinase, partial [Chitinophagaceae bacterium]|nr:sensor histidine kinase [Chitinophagaceae bacterium]